MSFSYDLQQISEEAMRVGMVCFEWDMSHTGSVRIPGPQLVALIEKVLETLMRWSLLKDVGHWGWALRLYSPALLPTNRCSVTSQSPTLNTVPSFPTSFPNMMSCIPLKYKIE